MKDLSERVKFLRDYGEWGELDWDIAGEMPEEYVEFVKENVLGRRVAELGVGSGRMALPLVRSGYEVVGVERSAGLIGSFVRRCSPKVVRSCCLDFCEDRAPDIEVDGVILGYNVMSMNVDKSARIRGYSFAREILRKGGTLIVQNFTTAMVDGILGGCCEKYVSISAGGSDWVIRYRYDRSSNRLCVDYYEDIDDVMARVRKIESVVQTVSEICGEVGSCGFTVESLCEGWGGGEFTDASEEVIIVAHC